MNVLVPKPKPPRRSGVVRWLQWGAVSLVLYAVIGFFILPLIVRAVAIKQIAAQLDRQVAIHQVRINPFVLSATIRGLLIKDKDGEPFVSWDEVYANFQLSSFFGKHWVFKDIHATQPFVRVSWCGATRGALGKSYGSGHHAPG